MEAGSVVSSVVALTAVGPAAFAGTVLIDVANAVTRGPEHFFLLAPALMAAVGTPHLAHRAPA